MPTRTRAPRKQFRIGRNRHGTPVILCNLTRDGVRHRRELPIAPGVDPAFLIAALQTATARGDLSWSSPDGGFDPHPYYLEAAGLVATPPPSSAEPGAPASASPTLADWAPGYRAALRELSSSATYRDAVRGQVRAIVAALGDRPLDSFHYGETRLLAAKLSHHLTRPGESVAPETILNRLRRLRDMLRLAQISGQLAHPSPLLSDHLPRELARASNLRKRSKAPLSADELAALVGALALPAGHLEAVGCLLSEFALRSGLRFGEVAGLHWARSLPRPGRVRIDGAWSKREQRAKRTKTGEAWSIVRTEGLGAVLARVAPLTRLSGGYVFAHPGSGGSAPLEYVAWRRTLAAAMARAGVEWRPGLAQKLFRKTFVTAGGVCGLPLKLLASQYGHTTTITIQREYDLHVDPDNWPSPAECEAYARIFGFDELLAARAAAAARGPG